MKKNNKTKQSLLLLVSLCSLNITAQEVWNIDQCMAYAVEHNHIVKQRHLEADNYRMDRMKAIGQFLPGVSGNVSAQYNFGRSVIRKLIHIYQNQPSIMVIAWKPPFLSSGEEA